MASLTIDGRVIEAPAGAPLAEEDSRGKVLQTPVGDFAFVAGVTIW